MRSRASPDSQGLLTWAFIAYHLFGGQAHGRTEHAQASSTLSGNSARAANWLLTSTEKRVAASGERSRASVLNFLLAPALVFGACWRDSCMAATTMWWSVFEAHSALRYTLQDVNRRLSRLMMWSISFSVTPSLDIQVMRWVRRRSNQDPSCEASYLLMA